MRLLLLLSIVACGCAAKVCGQLVENQKTFTKGDGWSIRVIPHRTCQPGKTTFILRIRTSGVPLRVDRQKMRLVHEQRQIEVAALQEYVPIGLLGRVDLPAAVDVDHDDEIPVNFPSFGDEQIEDRIIFYFGRAITVDGAPVKIKPLILQYGEPE